MLLDLEKQINKILEKIEKFQCGKIILSNILEKENCVVIVLKEEIGVISDSNEYYKRLEILEELKCLFVDKKVKITYEKK